MGFAPQFYLSHDVAQSWTLPFAWMGYRLVMMPLQPMQMESVETAGRILPGDHNFILHKPFAVLQESAFKAPRGGDPLPQDSLHTLSIRDADDPAFRMLVFGVMAVSGARILLPKGGDVPPRIYSFPGQAQVDACLEKACALPRTASRETWKGGAGHGIFLTGRSDAGAFSLVSGIGRAAQDGSERRFIALSGGGEAIPERIVLANGGQLLAVHSV